MIILDHIYIHVYTYKKIMLLVSESNSITTTIEPYKLRIVKNQKISTWFDIVEVTTLTVTIIIHIMDLFVLSKIEIILLLNHLIIMIKS